LEKKFIKFLIISFVIHLLVSYSVFTYFNKSRLEFNFKEKNVNVEIAKINRKEIKKLYKKKRSKLGDVKNIEGYKGSVSEKILDQTVDFTISDSEYTYKEIEVDKKIFVKEKKNLFKDEDLSKYNKNDLESMNKNEALSFLDGNKRKLVNSYIDELKNLNIEANVKFKAKIEITKEGDVNKIEIMESSGDITKDNYITEIIKKWKFDEGEKLIQVVIVELKYLLD